MSLVGSNPTLSAVLYGEVLEWTIRRAWRARVALATVGSNPTLSAKNSILFYYNTYARMSRTYG